MVLRFVPNLATRRSSRGGSSRRRTAATCACLAGGLLVFGQGSSASGGDVYAPVFGVVTPAALRSSGEVKVSAARLAEGGADAPTTARTIVYVPQGYVLDVSLRPGT